MTPDLATLVPPLRGRVLVITGAGASAESQIPTFRGAGGYWRQQDPQQLATPEAFRRDPVLVWDWYRERRARIRTAAPNAAHQALAALGRVAADHLLVTQNVDDLHERAGSDRERLVHVHGEIVVSRCTRCRYETRDEPAGEGIPRCPVCASLLRPGVVWFGESLDPGRIAVVERFLARPVDMVLLVGTTAMFGYILDWATRGGVLVEINPEPTAATPHAEHVVRGRAGDILPALIALAARP